MRTSAGEAHRPGSPRPTSNRADARRSPANLSRQPCGVDYHVDELDTDERHDDSAQTVNQKVTPEQRRGGHRPVLDATQRERDERDDDERVEDDGRQNRRLRRPQSHDVQRVQHGERCDAAEHGRDDGEVLRHVVRNREGGERAARHQELLAYLYNLDELRRVRVEVYHVAGLFGGLRPRVHRHAHVGLRERGRVVRAVAGHGDEFAFGLLALNQSHLVFGPGFGEEVVNARFARNRRRRERVVTRDHYGLNPHLPELVESLAHAPFDDVLQVDDAKWTFAVGDDQGRAALLRDVLDDLAHQRRRTPAVLTDVALDGVHSPFTYLEPVVVDTGHARLCSEGDE